MTGESKVKRVFIIESVDPEGFYEQRTDGHVAKEFLTLLGVQSQYLWL